MTDFSFDDFLETQEGEKSETTAQSDGGFSFDDFLNGAKSDSPSEIKDSPLPAEPVSSTVQMTSDVKSAPEEAAMTQKRGITMSADEMNVPQSSILSKEKAKEMGEMNANEVAARSYEQATGVDAPDNKILAHIANMGSNIGGRLNANLQMQAAQQLLAKSGNRSDDETRGLFSKMMFGAGKYLGLGFFWDDALEEWDETEGKSYKTPEERTRARNAFVDELARQFIAERTATKHNATMELKNRDQGFWATVLGKGPEQVGNSLPYMLGPVGIALQFAQQSAATGTGYANDEYGFAKDGSLGVVAEGDSAGKAVVKGIAAGGFETASEIAGGKIAGAVGKRLGKVLSKGGKVLVGKFPVITEKAGKFAETQVGQAVSKFGMGMKNLFAWTSKKLHLENPIEENIEEWETENLNAIFGTGARDSEYVNDDTGAPLDAWDRVKKANSEFFKPENFIKLNEAMLLTMGGGAFISHMAQRGMKKEVDSFLREHKLMTDEEIASTDLQTKAQALDAWAKGLSEEEVLKKINSATSLVDKLADKIAAEPSQAQKTVTLKRHLSEMNDFNSLIGRASEIDKAVREQGGTTKRFTVQQDEYGNPKFNTTIYVEPVTDDNVERKEMFDADSGVTIIDANGTYVVKSEVTGEKFKTSNFNRAINAADAMAVLNQQRVDERQTKRQVLENLLQNEAYSNRKIEVFETADQARRAIGGDFENDSPGFTTEDGTTVLILDNLDNPATALAALDKGTESDRGAFADGVNFETIAEKDDDGEVVETRVARDKVHDVTIIENPDGNGFTVFGKDVPYTNVATVEEATALARGEKIEIPNKEEATNETRTDEAPAQPEQAQSVTPPAGEEARPVEAGEAPSEVGGEVAANTFRGHEVPNSATDAQKHTLEAVFSDGKIVNIFVDDKGQMRVKTAQTVNGKEFYRDDIIGKDGNIIDDTQSADETASSEKAGKEVSEEEVNYGEKLLEADTQNPSKTVEVVNDGGEATQKLTKGVVEAPTSASTETQVNTPPTTTESAEGGSDAADAEVDNADKKTARVDEKATENADSAAQQPEIKPAPLEVGEAKNIKKRLEKKRKKGFALTEEETALLDRAEEAIKADEKAKRDASRALTEEKAKVVEVPEFFKKKSKSVAKGRIAEIEDYLNDPRHNGPSLSVAIEEVEKWKKYNERSLLYFPKIVSKINDEIENAKKRRDKLNAKTKLSNIESQQLIPQNKLRTYLSKTHSPLLEFWDRNNRKLIDRPMSRMSGKKNSQMGQYGKEKVYGKGNSFGFAGKDITVEGLNYFFDGMTAAGRDGFSRNTLLKFIFGEDTKEITNEYSSNNDVILNEITRFVNGDLSDYLTASEQNPTSHENSLNKIDYTQDVNTLLEDFLKEIFNFIEYAKSNETIEERQMREWYEHEEEQQQKEREEEIGPIIEEYALDELAARDAADNEYANAMAYVENNATAKDIAVLKPSNLLAAEEGDEIRMDHHKTKFGFVRYDAENGILYLSGFDEVETDEGTRLIPNERRFRVTEDSITEIAEEKNDTRRETGASDNRASDEKGASRGGSREEGQGGSQTEVEGRVREETERGNPREVSAGRTGESGARANNRPAGTAGNVNQRSSQYKTISKAVDLAWQSEHPDEVAELLKEGIDASAVTSNPNVKGTDEVSWPVTAMRVGNREDAANIFRIVSNPDVEITKVLYLDEDGNILDRRITNVGVIGESDINAENLISNIPEGTYGIILSHNHPAQQGDDVHPTIGYDDIATNWLKNLVESVGVKLLDHIITDHNAYYSFGGTSLVSEGANEFWSKAQALSDFFGESVEKPADVMNLVSYDERIDLTKDAIGRLNALAALASKTHDKSSWVVAVDDNGKVAWIAAAPKNANTAALRNFIAQHHGGRRYAVLNGENAVDMPSFLRALKGNEHVFAIGENGKLVDFGKDGSSLNDKILNAAKPIPTSIPTPRLANAPKLDDETTKEINDILGDMGGLLLRSTVMPIYTGSAADYANRSRQGGVDDGPSLVKVGSGEGSQVYGWGLYGSTVRDVAEVYIGRRKQSQDLMYKGQDIAPVFKFPRNATPKELALKFARVSSSVDGLLSNLEYEGMKDKSYKSQYTAAVEWVKTHRDDFSERPRGNNLYEQTFFTDRAPGDESHLLKWYEPVSEDMQNRLLESAVKEGKASKSGKYFFIGENTMLESGTRQTGEELYWMFRNMLGSPKAASEWLADHDIDGIKYPVDSYGSKGVKDGDEVGWNYVSFRDDNIRVDHKWVDGQMLYSPVASLTDEEEDKFFSGVRRMAKALKAKGYNTFEDMIRTVASMRPDIYERGKDLFRRAWNFYDVETDGITIARGAEIFDALDQELGAVETAPEPFTAVPTFDSDSESSVDAALRKTRGILSVMDRDFPLQDAAPETGRLASSVAELEASGGVAALAKNPERFRSTLAYNLLRAERVPLSDGNTSVSDFELLRRWKENGDYSAQAEVYQRYMGSDAKEGGLRGIIRKHAMEKGKYQYLSDREVERIASEIWFGRKPDKDKSRPWKRSAYKEDLIDGIFTDFAKGKLRFYKNANSLQSAFSQKIKWLFGEEGRKATDNYAALSYDAPNMSRDGERLVDNIAAPRSRDFIVDEAKLRERDARFEARRVRERDEAVSLVRKLIESETVPDRYKAIIEAFLEVERGVGDENKGNPIPSKKRLDAVYENWRAREVERDANATAGRTAFDNRVKELFDYINHDRNRDVAILADKLRLASNDATKKDLSVDDYASVKAYWDKMRAEGLNDRQINAAILNELNIEDDTFDVLWLLQNGEATADIAKEIYMPEGGWKSAKDKENAEKKIRAWKSRFNSVLIFANDLGLTSRYPQQPRKDADAERSAKIAELRKNQASEKIAKPAVLQPESDDLFSNASAPELFSAIWNQGLFTKAKTGSSGDLFDIPAQNGGETSNLFADLPKKPSQGMLLSPVAPLDNMRLAAVEDMVQSLVEPMKKNGYDSFGDLTRVIAAKDIALFSKVRPYLREAWNRTTGQNVALTTAENIFRDYEARLAALRPVRSRGIDGRTIDTTGEKTEANPLGRALVPEDGSMQQIIDKQIAATQKTQNTPPSPAPGSVGNEKLKHDYEPEAFGSGIDDNPIAREEIIDKFRELFPDVAIRGRGTRPLGKNTAGHFEPGAGIIRSKNPVSLRTIPHEIGHYIDAAYKSMGLKRPTSVQLDLYRLGKNLYGDKVPNGGYESEGFAELLKFYMQGNTEGLKKEAPAAYNWLMNDFATRKPDVMARVDAIRDLIDRFQNQSGIQAVRAMTVPDPSLGRKLVNTLVDVVNAVKPTQENWIDKGAFISKAMKASGINKLFDWREAMKKKDYAEMNRIIENHPVLKWKLYNGKAGMRAFKALEDGLTDLSGTRRYTYGDLGVVTLGHAADEVLPTFKEIFKDFTPKELDEFKKEYAVARVAKELYLDKGLPFGLTEKEIAPVLKKYANNTKFKEALDLYTHYKHGVLHLLVDAGAMSQEQFEAIVKNNPIYVKISRHMDSLDAFKKAMMRRNGKAVNERRGGSQRIEDIFDAGLIDDERVFRAAFQADLFRSIINAGKLAEQNGGTEAGFSVGANWIHEVPNAQGAVTFSSEKLRKQIVEALKKSGAEGANGETGETLFDALFGNGENLTIFKEKPSNGKKGIVSIYGEDGRLHTYELPDNNAEGWAKGLLDFTDGNTFASLWEKWGEMSVSAVRAGATQLNPMFALRNLLRDTLNAATYNQYGKFIPVVGSVEGVVKDIMNSKPAQMYKSMGLEMGGFMGRSRLAGARKSNNYLLSKNWAEAQLRKGFFKAIADVVGITENGTRVKNFENAYDYMLKNGASDKAAQMIAGCWSLDATVDFLRSGTTGQKINKFIPFFNAGIQGIDQFLRGFGLQDPKAWDLSNSGKERAARTFMQGVSWLTTLSILGWIVSNALRDEDDPEDEELPPHERWNYISFGNFRMPIPYEAGYIFASIPKAILETVVKGDANALPECLKMFATSFPLQAGSLHELMRNNALFAPLIDVAFNEDWKGSQIVPSYVRDSKESWEWYTRRTTGLSKDLGKALHKIIGNSYFSAPAYIDTMFDGWTGGLYSKLAKLAYGESELGFDTTRPNDWPIVGTLFRSPTATRVAGNFYDELKELERKVGSGTATVEEAGRKVVLDETANKIRPLWDENGKMMQPNSGLSRKYRFDKMDENNLKARREIKSTPTDAATLRKEGIRKLAISASNPASSEHLVENSLKMLKSSGVTLQEAKDAILRYAKETGKIKGATIGRHWLILEAVWEGKEIPDGLKRKKRQ